MRKNLHHVVPWMCQPCGRWQTTRQASAPQTSAWQPLPASMADTTGDPHPHQRTSSATMCGLGCSSGATHNVLHRRTWLRQEAEAHRCRQANNVEKLRWRSHIWHRSADDASRFWSTDHHIFAPGCIAEIPIFADSSAPGCSRPASSSRVAVSGLLIARFDTGRWERMRAPFVHLANHASQR